MKGEDYRRILDFFFSGVEVSDELKQRYLGWLAAYGDEGFAGGILGLCLFGLS